MQANGNSSYFEKVDDENPVLRKIMDVEEVCWKQKWRLDNHILLDEYSLKDWLIVPYGCVSLIQE